MLGVELSVSHVSFETLAMGSSVQIAVTDARHGVEAWAATRLAEMERCWSRFDPSSELSLLNARNGSGPQPASALLCEAVDAAVCLWRATDGWFDPTTLDALEGAGYDRSFTDLRGRDVAATSSDNEPVPTPSGVVVDHERGSITLPRGVRLDLGGVGKGLAADHLASEIVERGASSACVSVGGDVAMAGVAPDCGWVIPVTSPLDPDRVHWNVPLRRGAIVQSSRLVRAWTQGGEARHHLIDPHTGAPSTSSAAGVVVIADRAWWAEGVAKAALLAGAVGGVALIERLATGGWIVCGDGTVRLAGGLSVERAA